MTTIGRPSAAHMRTRQTPVFMPRQTKFSGHIVFRSVRPSVRRQSVRPAHVKIWIQVSFL